jgi:hypothetical protein
MLIFLFVVAFLWRKEKKNKRQKRKKRKKKKGPKQKIFLKTAT